jgi:hypothetical protein
MRKQAAESLAAAALHLPARSAAPEGTNDEPSPSSQHRSSTRTVRVQTPKGHTTSPSPEFARQIQIGSRYGVRYSEPVVVGIETGASAATGGATAKVEPKEGAKGGEGVKMGSVAGTVEAMDPASREIIVRTADGAKQAFKVPENAVVGPLKAGDPITLTYMQAIATQIASTPQPVSDPAPAP